MADFDDSFTFNDNLIIKQKNPEQQATNLIKALANVCDSKPKKDEMLTEIINQILFRTCRNIKETDFSLPLLTRLVGIDLLDELNKFCKIDLITKNDSPPETVVDFIVYTITDPKFKSIHTNKKPIELIRRLETIVNVEGLNKATPYFLSMAARNKGQQ